MGEAFYFHVTLEPHKKRSGSKTGRRILFLVEVPIDAAKSSASDPQDESVLRQEAERLSRELAPIAMTGELRSMPNARTKPHAEGARPLPTIGRAGLTRGIKHQLLQETLSLFPLCVEMLDATFD